MTLIMLVAIVNEDEAVRGAAMGVIRGKGDPWFLFPEIWFVSLALVTNLETEVPF